MFEWDEALAEKLWTRHRVTLDQAEEAMLDRHGYGIPAYNVEDERRFGRVGATDDGRLLRLIFTRRAGAIRILSAADALPAERRRYDRRRGL